MTSTKQGPLLCKTTGGVKIVAIPGFPGERIDRRLLADIKWLRKRYPIFITDAYSTDPVHAANGEHPLGLAADIVPDKAHGGSWNDIDKLAKWAEPKPNRPRFPFRWVGYNGDEGHGRGNHLHLSWAHSVPTKRKRARTVYTLKCPAPVSGAPAGGTTTGSGTSKPKPRPGHPSGGVAAGKAGRIAPPHPERRESGGVRAR